MLKRRDWLLWALASGAAAGPARAAAPLSVWVDPAPAGSGLDLPAIFARVLGNASPASHELEAVVPASKESGAQVRLVPRVRRVPQPRDQARLVLETTVNIAVPGAPRALLECRNETSVVLPLHGEGGWDEDGLYSLGSAVRRSARDVIVLLQTEMSMRSRGYFPSTVSRDRLVEVELMTEVRGMPHECLVIRETGASLFLAEADAGGRVSDNRLIVDKPLLVER